MVYLSEGNYGTQDIINKGGNNNDISSLRIVGEYKVTLYQNDNFQGTYYTATSSIPNFLSIGWNDIASSIKVEKTTSTTTTEETTTEETTTEETATSSDGTALYNNARDAVVTLTMTLGGSMWSGSGFFIKYNSQYYICTVAHNVIQSDRNSRKDNVYASISNYDNTGINKVVACQVIGVAGLADIAVLQLSVTLTNQTYLNWGDSETAKIGSECYVIGDPYGIDAVSVSNGVIRDNKYIHGNIVESMCVSAPIYGGNSGSPILDGEGDVIGIISYGYSTSDTFTWGSAQKVMEPLIANIVDQNGNFVGGTLNAALYAVTASYLHNKNKIPYDLAGFYVNSTSNGDLTTNDVITQISGNTIGLYYNQATPAVIYMNPGTQILTKLLNIVTDATQTTTLSISDISVADDKPLGSSSTSTSATRIGPVLRVG